MLHLQVMNSKSIYLDTHKPFMVQCFPRCDPFLGVEVRHLHNEVLEIVVEVFVLP
jgi:hypothetical protein